MDMSSKARRELPHDLEARMDSEGEEFSKNVAWFLEHQGELTRYRGEWLVVAHQRLVDHGRDHGELRRRHASDGGAYFTGLPEEDVELMLTHAQYLA
jgi:hypothetical protein